MSSPPPFQSASAQIEGATQNLQAELSESQSQYHKITSTTWFQLTLHSIQSYVTSVPQRTVAQAVHSSDVRVAPADKVDALSHAIQNTCEAVARWVSAHTRTGMARDMLRAVGRPVHEYLNQTLTRLDEFGPSVSPITKYIQTLQAIGATINLAMVIKNILCVNQVAREIEVIGEQIVQWEFEYLDQIHESRRGCESCAAAIIECFNEADPAEIQSLIFMSTQFSTLSTQLNGYVEHVVRAKHALATIKNRALPEADPRAEFTRSILEASSDDLISFDARSTPRIVRSVSVDRVPQTSHFVLTTGQIDEIKESLRRSEDRMAEILDHQLLFDSVVATLSECVSSYEFQARQALAIICEKNRIIAEQQAQIKALQSIVVRQESVRSSMRSSVAFFS